MSSGSNYTSTINVFDTETNSITTLSATLPTAAYYIAAAAVGTKVYLFGGQYFSGNLNTINALTIFALLATNYVQLQIQMQKNLFNLIVGAAATVEVGVENVYLGNADGYAEKVAAALYIDGVWTEI